MDSSPSTQPEPSADVAGRRGPLEGLRVLDMADWPGAFAAKQLADLGADTIKVEPPGGDPQRSVGPFWHDTPHPDRSLSFWFYNTSKRSLTLDLTRPAGRDVFARLAERTDAVIETGAPGELERLGLGYEALRRINERIVLASITPFGQSGPRRDWRASEIVAEAASGMLYVNGFPGEAPITTPGNQAYHSTGVYAAIATLAALIARDHTGAGQWVDISLQEATAAAVEHVAAFFHQMGRIHRRAGSLHWTRYFRVARCRDGYALHCSLGDWTSLIEWVKADGKAQDLAEPVWDDFNHRRRHCEHLFDVLDEWAKDYAVADLVDGAQLRRIPYAAVRPPEALLQDEQLAAREFFTPVAHPELGVGSDADVLYPGAPFRLSDSPWAIRCRPPRVGEHTEDILCSDLGLSAAEVATLRADGIV